MIPWLVLQVYTGRMPMFCLARPNDTMYAKIPACVLRIALLALRAGQGVCCCPFSMVVRVGPPATRNRELGQARKGAAAAVDVCAGVRLAGTASLQIG